METQVQGENSYTTLPKDSNQAAGLAEYAKAFMAQHHGNIFDEVYERVRLFHTDSVLCGVSAIAQKTSAPNVLRDEAMKMYGLQDKGQAPYAKVFGSSVWQHAEKAIVANCSAVREWDSNGTVFGYNPKLEGHQAGEFGHNDFYPVVIAACQQTNKYNGQEALKAMVLLDEIRGRLAEVFSLKSYKIDHVVHGAIASAVVYGVLLDASSLEIEHAVGMVVAHYIPWRAIRAGKQLSDSKGASAAISTEAAIMSVHRAMAGFIGPKDIFRNPEALFRQFEPTEGDTSPFNLVLTMSGNDFAVMGMHFKLGIYEHQSAGAIGGILKLLQENLTGILAPGNDISNIGSIKITAYQPAFGIIGDPAKKNPTTRQSADHSMCYIIASLLSKAFTKFTELTADHELLTLWQKLMLLPVDYGAEGMNDQLKRELMTKIEFSHGGPSYDEKYPEGIPTSVAITNKKGETFDSGLVMFPGGHAANKDVDLKTMLQYKFLRMAEYAMKDASAFVAKVDNIANATAEELQEIYDCQIEFAEKSIDE